MFIRQLADLRMWAGASGLVIMLSACIVIVRQRGEKRRREIVTAELVAQYHNALVDARMRLERAIADNSALREAAQTTAVACNALDASPNSLPASPGMYLETNFPARARRTAAIPESPQINTRIAELERQLRESREREKRLERELERVPPQPRPKPPQKLAERSPRGTTPL
jgi:predicted RNase H-like nuclease (RuvC/YqgF family)